LTVVATISGGGSAVSSIALVAGFGMASFFPSKAMALALSTRWKIAGSGRNGSVPTALAVPGEQGASE
jgi:hypothetical protein